MALQQIPTEDIPKTGCYLQFEALDLGLIDYTQATLLQQSLIEEIHSGKRISTLILCEHPPVITLGRTSSEKNILKPLDIIEKSGISICKANRGGDVTLHLPGQLVVYPIFDLRLLGRDINKYLRNLEQIIILLLRDYEISAQRKDGYTGVWIRNKKIASIGIAIKNWISSHGLSLNINCNLSLFSLIKPCGQDIIMTSLKEEAPSGLSISVQEVKGAIIKEFEIILNHA